MPWLAKRAGTGTRDLPTRRHAQESRPLVIQGRHVDDRIYVPEHARTKKNPHLVWVFFRRDRRLGCFTLSTVRSRTFERPQRTAEGRDCDCNLVVAPERSGRCKE